MSDTLFDVDAPRARTTDDNASHEAAARTSLIQGRLRAQIIELFGRYSTGFTKNETCKMLALDPRVWPTCASALSQLKNLGLLSWTGEKRDGQNMWRLSEQSVDVRNGSL